MDADFPTRLDPPGPHSHVGQTAPVEPGPIPGTLPPTSPRASSSAAITHQVAVTGRTGPLDLDVQFTLHSGWTALFAPSGAGKTTLLRILAGLDRPSSGRIVCQFAPPPLPHAQALEPPSEVVLFDHLAGIDRPAHKRMIRLVAQRPALFPHRSVFGNVTWATPGGPAFDRGRPIPEALDQILTICRMQHLLNKMPAGLSGGERQRVALARSLAASPMNLLLLDEPFTGIEADLRDAIIHDLRSYLAERGIPVLLVTHDLGEVFASRAEVLKMHAGRIVAQGPAEQVLAAERDRLVARLRSAAPTL